MVVINGKEENVQGISILEYLESVSIKPERVVVERNLEIIQRENYKDVYITDGDTIEILNFVGGG